MFFRVQDLGPLKDAEVDLSKRLIVLAGPNNSGKTYLAWSVYGVHRARWENAIDLSSLVKRLLESPEHRLDANELFAELEGGPLEKIVAACESQLHLCFAAESSRFARTRISLRELRGVSALGTDMESVLAGTGGESEWFGLSMNEHGTIELNLGLVSNESPQSWKPKFPKISSMLAAFIRLWLFPLCTLFPAERMAINIFAKELALKRTALVDELVDADIEQQASLPLELIRRNAGRYPWPIRDSLRTANDLANLSKRKSDYSDLADELERAVLGGQVSVSEYGEMLFSPQGTENTSLPMHLSASLVKSLSSLVFYFRHLAQEGNFLIIDEPELNLHPDNQRKVTRLLVKAINRGLKIMMSTHSDYVLRELNHLIMLNQIPEAEAREMGYDPEWALSSERLGVYLFDEHQAQPVPIEETGFSIKTIDDVVNQLNADEQRLYARLSE